jgi:hypothetical protein
MLSFLTLSLFFFGFKRLIVSISTVFIPFIIQYACHNVVTEFVNLFFLSLRYEHKLYGEMYFGVIKEKRFETIGLQDEQLML